jgi:hypothetical protein
MLTAAVQERSVRVPKPVGIRAESVDRRHEILIRTFADGDFSLIAQVFATATAACDLVWALEPRASLSDNFAK